MNDLKKGDILYRADLFNNRISIGKCIFVRYSGNKIIGNAHGFNCEYSKSLLFLTPIEALENALKKYADVW